MAKILAFSPLAIFALLPLVLISVFPTFAVCSVGTNDQKQKPLVDIDHPPTQDRKLKAAGFNTVSIYFHWGVVEYERGVFRWNELFDLQPFFDAAKEAGLYVIARPGPYVNAETTGGGFPGWGTRVEGLWRKSNQNYTDAWKPFVEEFGKIIAKNEITKGGPIILVQVENEYSGFGDGHGEDIAYETELLKAFKDSGITVPTICDDAWLGGNFQSVDIYGWNSYPLGFDCSHPDRWHAAPPDFFYNLYHSKIKNPGPKAILELQAGGFDGWYAPPNVMHNLSFLTSNLRLVGEALDMTHVES
ncbi:Beta-galactosidase [Dactylellina cionopaga]|nr:Beta-galactosidase [Dactylellina cionopaga]